jgi:hypothetical protein
MTLDSDSDSDCGVSQSQVSLQLLQLRPETVREPRGKGTFAIGSRYQTICEDEDIAGWEDLRVCPSEL